MRKVFLMLSLVVTMVTVSQAQIRKGSILLGGSIGVSTERIKSGMMGLEDRKASYFNVLTSFGKAIKDNLVVSGMLGFGSNSSKYSSSQSKSNGNSYFAGAFLRKYMNLGTGGFYFFSDAGLIGTYLWQKSAYNFSASSRFKSVDLSLGLTPGLSYAVNKRFHLETSLVSLINIHYTSYRVKNSSGLGDNIKGNIFSLSSSFSNNQYPFNVGFRVLLSKQI